MDTKGQKLEALLYAHGGEMKKTDIASMLGISPREVDSYKDELLILLQDRGIEVFETPTTLSLRTGIAYADFINELQQKDSEKDIGTAGLEVLAIVLYKGGASRTLIDYIRGVNSSGTLRQLVLRGLLERSKDADDSRAYMYAPTPELLAHLGITSCADLPKYDTLSAALRDQQGEETITDTNE